LDFPESGQNTSSKETSASAAKMPKLDPNSKTPALMVANAENRKGTNRVRRRPPETCHLYSAVEGAPAYATEEELVVDLQIRAWAVFERRKSNRSHPAVEGVHLFAPLFFPLLSRQLTRFLSTLRYRHRKRVLVVLLLRRS
jgi:hypothetical protein